jgi:hypothetical protein
MNGFTPSNDAPESLLEQVDALGGAVGFSGMGQGNWGTQLVAALLTAGTSPNDMILRGGASREMIGAMLQLIRRDDRRRQRRERAMRAAGRMDEEINDELDFRRMSPGAAMAYRAHLLAAAADGNARRETQAAFVGQSIAIQAANQGQQRGKTMMSNFRKGS